MSIAHWAVQSLLAIAFLLAGVMKAPQPLDKLGTSMGWVKAVPPGLVRFIGVAELLVGIGLVLPLLTGILPWLTPTAAVGLLIMMVGAMMFHAARREFPAMEFNVGICVLAAFVSYGRFVIVPG
jgi:uncharacterized membrane protein YphA (DoxX/SURF4 family)